MDSQKLEVGCLKSEERERKEGGSVLKVVRTCRKAFCGHILS